MSQKIEALFRVFAAIAIIYFGQQLLNEGKRRLGV
jgi:hypothetical protein